MLFYENLIIGIIALIIGMSIGALLSKVFSMLLLKVMQLSTTISFSFSLEAIIHTTLVFTIIILITSFHGYSIIYKFKLIELLQAERQSELIPKGSIWTAFIRNYFSYCFLLVRTSTYFLFYMAGPQDTEYVYYFRWFYNRYIFHISFFYCFYYLAYRRIKHAITAINVVSVSQLLARIQANAKTNYHCTIKRSHTMWNRCFL